MNIKKIISVLMSLMLTTACMTSPALAEKTTKETETIEKGETVKEDLNNYKAASVLTALGLIEAPKLSDDWSAKKLTNYEFLKMVLVMTDFSEETTYNVILPWEGYESGTEHYNVYAYAYLNAWLQDGDEIGAPTDTLTLDFARNFMMKLMGYYPQVNTSQRSKAEGELIKNVRLSDDGTISINDVYAMMYAATTIDCYHMELVDGQPGYVLRDGRSIITYNKNIYQIKGKVNATQYASLNGINVSSGQIAINTDKFFIDDMSYVSLIGKMVSGYAYIKSGDGARALYLEAMENRSSDIVIQGKDFVSFSGNYVTYDTASGREKRQTVKDPVIIYNGKQVEGSQYNDNIFDIVEGDVTLVSNDGEINVIIINKYNNIVIGSVDEDKKKIFDDVYQGVSLDINKPDVHIKNPSGNLVDIGDMKKGSVLTYAQSLDEEYVIGTVGGIMLTGKISTMDKGNDGYVTISGTKYTFTAETEAIKTSLMMGIEYTFYINVNGRLAGVKSLSSISGEIGYLLKTYTDPHNDEKVKIKILKPDAIDQNDAVWLNCRSRCIVDGEQYRNGAITTAITTNNSGASDLPIIYKLDESGLVSEIDTPYFNGAYENEETTLQRRHSATDEYKIYSKTATGFGYRNLFFIDTPNRPYESAGATYIMDFDGMCIQKLVSSGEFNILNLVKNDSNNTMDLYSVGKETPMVCFSVITAGVTSEPTYESTMAVVQAKYETINSNDDVVTMLSLVIKGDTKEYEILEAKKANIVPEVDEGDVIIYALDPKDRIEKVERLLDYSDKASSMGKKATLNGGDAIYIGRVYDIFKTTNMKAGTNNTVLQFAVDASNTDKRTTFARSGVTYSYSMEGEKGVVMESMDPNKIKTFKNAGTDADYVVLITNYSIPTNIYIVPNKE